MGDEIQFEELLALVRRGDADTAIRVAVRTRLSDPALRRQFDSIDICQSVLASFFIRAAAGQYDLHDPKQLVALLTRMAHNKLAMHARHQYRHRRDVRRVASLNDCGPEVATTNPGPLRHATGRDLLERVYAMMEPPVREMVEYRAVGTGWREIAARLGGTAESRRKQFQRAIDRIAVLLNID
jgi:DNA-directed RNA polymerase specialized sigma24 family protein